ncbi:hypothetical protein WNZ14_23085 [Hoeflea sp. AS60]|uniref:hypothetical protein n=1 Tax=Hoeflea sp. AS60 TaxID=3135780 RepID=UPI00317D75BE
MKRLITDWETKRRIVAEGTRWVRDGKFWLFGTATYYDAANISDRELKSDAKHFFNVLDRHLVPHKEFREGLRLPRLVFVEHGRSRTNPHFHFYIKGNCWHQYRQIHDAAPTCWKKKIRKSHSMVISDNLGPQHRRNGYGWKEFDSLYKETLLVDCCHLNFGD